jgi:hypothetical protein
MSSELMTPKFFRNFCYVCRYFDLSVFLLVSGTHCNYYLRFCSCHDTYLSQNMKQKTFSPKMWRNSS